MKSKKILIIILFFSCAMTVAGQKKTHQKKGKGYLTVSVIYSDAKPSDTLQIKLDSYMFVFADLPDRYRFATMDQNHIFRFRVPISKNCGYFEIRKMFSSHNPQYGPYNSTQLVKELFWENGDNITIKMTRKKQATDLSYMYSFDDYETVFSGSGSIKYFAAVKTDSAYFAIATQSDGEFEKGFISGNLNVNTLQRNFKNVHAAKCILDKYKPIISKTAYNALKADVLFQQGGAKFETIGSYYRNNVLNASVESQRLFLSRIINEEDEYQRLSRIPETELSNSKEFIAYSYYKSLWVSLLSRQKTSFDDINRDSIYYTIKNKFKGPIRDKLILYDLNIAIPEHINDVLNDALTTVNSPALLLKIKDYRNKWIQGTKGYNFSLPDVNGKYHSLSDFRGKMVLMDFWFTGCGSCINLNKHAVTPAEEYFKRDTNVVFISISLDSRKQIWQASVAGGEYTGPNCLKVYTDGKGYNHQIVSEYAITSFPAVILMDKYGRIARYNTSDIQEKNSLIKVIDNLKQSNDHDSIAN